MYIAVIICQAFFAMLQFAFSVSCACAYSSSIVSFARYSSVACLHCLQKEQVVLRRAVALPCTLTRTGKRGVQQLQILFLGLNLTVASHSLSSLLCVENVKGRPVSAGSALSAAVVSVEALRVTLAVTRRQMAGFTSAEQLCTSLRANMTCNCVKKGGTFPWKWLPRCKQG